MDKGQHLRLIFVPSAHEYFVALVTQMSFHLSATTENSTTKDSSDGTGVVWDEYEVTQRGGDINFTAILGVGTDSAEGDSYTFADFVSMVTDDILSWKLAMTSGENNRTVGKTVCTGSAKLSNIQVAAQNRTMTTFTGTLNLYGAVTVGTD